MLSLRFCGAAGGAPSCALPYFLLVIRQAPYTVGRLPNNDLSFPSQKDISRQYATLEVVSIPLAFEAEQQRQAPRNDEDEDDYEDDDYADEVPPPFELGLKVTNHSQFGFHIRRADASAAAAASSSSSPHGDEEEESRECVFSSAILTTGDVLWFGQQLCYQVEYRPLVVSIAKDHYDPQYVQELQALYQCLGATVLPHGPEAVYRRQMLAGPRCNKSSAAAHPTSNDHHEPRADHSDPAPVGLIHVAEEISDDSWSLQALAFGYSIVLPQYVLEWYGCISQTPSLSLQDLPAPLTFEPSKKVSVFGAHASYVRPECPSVPFSWFPVPDGAVGQRRGREGSTASAIATSAANGVHRPPQSHSPLPPHSVATTATTTKFSTQGLFHHSLFLMTSELMSLRNRVCIEYAGGAVLPYSEIRHLAEQYLERLAQECAKRNVTQLDPVLQHRMDKRAMQSLENLCHRVLEDFYRPLQLQDASATHVYFLLGEDQRCASAMHPSLEETIRTAAALQDYGTLIYALWSKVWHGEHPPPQHHHDDTSAAGGGPTMDNLGFGTNLSFAANVAASSSSAPRGPTSHVRYLSVARGLEERSIHCALLSNEFVPMSSFVDPLFQPIPRDDDDDNEEDVDPQLAMDATNLASIQRNTQYEEADEEVFRRIRKQPYGADTNATESPIPGRSVQTLLSRTALSQQQQRYRQTGQSSSEAPIFQSPSPTAPPKRPQRSAGGNLLMTDVEPQQPPLDADAQSDRTPSVLSEEVAQQDDPYRANLVGRPANSCAHLLSFQQEREQIKRALVRCLPPAVVEQLAALRLRRSKFSRERLGDADRAFCRRVVDQTGVLLRQLEAVSQQSVEEKGEPRSFFPSTSLGTQSDAVAELWQRCSSAFDLASALLDERLLPQQSPYRGGGTVVEANAPEGGLPSAGGADLPSRRGGPSAAAVAVHEDPIAAGAAELSPSRRSRMDAPQLPPSEQPHHALTPSGVRYGTAVARYPPIPTHLVQPRTKKAPTAVVVSSPVRQRGNRAAAEVEQHNAAVQFLEKYPQFGQDPITASLRPIHQQTAMLMTPVMPNEFGKLTARKRMFREAYGASEGEVRFALWMRSQGAKWTMELYQNLESRRMTMTDLFRYE